MYSQRVRELILARLFGEGIEKWRRFVDMIVNAEVLGPDAIEDDEENIRLGHDRFKLLLTGLRLVYSDLATCGRFLPVSTNVPRGPSRRSRWTMGTNCYR